MRRYRLMRDDYEAQGLIIGYRQYNLHINRMFILLCPNCQGICHQIVYLSRIFFTIFMDCTERIPSWNASASASAFALLYLNNTHFSLYMNRISPQAKNSQYSMVLHYCSLSWRLFYYILSTPSPALNFHNTFSIHLF